MRLPLQYIRSVAIYYFTPTSLSNLWSFGVGAFVFLLSQIITGFILITYYIPYTIEAAHSIEHLMRDVNAGWLVRYAHISGASFFFFMIYAHISRGIFYGSYVHPRANAWLSGTIIFYLGMLTAFSGYILPWGQMSYWAATVITNLLTVFPYGSSLVTWVWGGSTITTITLSRFFTIHFITPFVIAALVFLHIVFLHTYGSGNPNSRSAESYDFSYFSPYYIVKDIVAIGVVFTLFMISLLYYSLALAHPDNYVPANPFVTPNHIVPEWYFLPVYAILRSCPTKIEGIMAFASTILILLNVYFFSWNYLYPNNLGYTGKTRRYIAIAIICSYLVLMYAGACSIEEPFISLGEQGTFIYFYAIALLVLLPIRADGIIWKIARVLIESQRTSPIKYGVYQKKAKLSSMNFVSRAYSSSSYEHPMNINSPCTKEIIVMQSAKPQHVISTKNGFNIINEIYDLKLLNNPYLNKSIFSFNMFVNPSEYNMIMRRWTTIKYDLYCDCGHYDRKFFWLAFCTFKHCGQSVKFYEQFTQNEKRLFDLAERNSSYFGDESISILCEFTFEVDHMIENPRNNFWLNHINSNFYIGHFYYA